MTVWLDGDRRDTVKTALVVFTLGLVTATLPMATGDKARVLASARLLKVLGSVLVPVTWAVLSRFPPALGTMVTVTVADAPAARLPRLALKPFV